jgi:hypothetical protein
MQVMSAPAVRGTGLSGFLAHALQPLYDHFPFRDQFDWLVLFLLVGAVTYLLFLPYLWKSIQADMACLRASHDHVPNQGLVAGIWGFGCLAAMLWFFHTEAGRTAFLGRRELPLIGPLVETSRELYWFSLVFVVLVLGLLAYLDGEASERNHALRLQRSRPARKRDFLSLYGGGGTYISLVGGVPAVQSTFTSSVVLWQALAILAAHLLYWYWSAASLLLMHCFLLMAVLGDGVRVGFVYVLHRRTFG